MMTKSFYRLYIQKYFQFRQNAGRNIRRRPSGLARLNAKNKNNQPRNTTRTRKMDSAPDPEEHA